METAKANVSPLIVIIVLDYFTIRTKKEALVLFYELNFVTKVFGYL